MAACHSTLSLSRGRTPSRSHQPLRRCSYIPPPPRSGPESRPGRRQDGGLPVASAEGAAALQASHAAPRVLVYVSVSRRPSAPDRSPHGPLLPPDLREDTHPHHPQPSPTPVCLGVVVLTWGRFPISEERFLSLSLS